MNLGCACKSGTLALERLSMRETGMDMDSMSVTTGALVHAVEQAQRYVNEEAAVLSSLKCEVSTRRLLSTFATTNTLLIRSIWLSRCLTPKPNRDNWHTSV